MVAQYLLALDSGQTATKAILATLDGRVVGRGRGGPGDHLQLADGTERNRRALHDAIRDAYRAAGLTPGEVEAVAVSHTAIYPHCAEISAIEAILRGIIAPRYVAIVSDTVASLVGAAAGGDGVVVIAGGGSVAYGATADGREARAGGFGYLLGDEGSAYDIGRRAVVAATRASDGRGPTTSLESIVREAFALVDIRQIMIVVYTSSFPRERFSALAPAVARAADAGDAVARDIMITAGQELAALAVAVGKRLYTPTAAVDIYPTGGVFSAGDVLWQPFTECIRTSLNGATVRVPALDPATGALILARRACNLPVREDWLSTVRKTMPQG